MSVLLCLAFPLTSACDGSHVESVGGGWMEWPAEVRVATGFDVRIVGFLPQCGAEYVRRYRIDQANSAIVFTPYAVVPDEPPCVNVAPPMFQDSIALPGLTEGTYQIRTEERVFGEQASVARDQAACLRVIPAVQLIVRPLPLENPPDPTPSSNAFVNGYLYTAPAPICGEARVFHLVAMN